MAAEDDSRAGSVVARTRARVLDLRAAALRHPLSRLPLRCLQEVNRIEIFDRSMTLAAQVFTSVFPILILLAIVATQADLVDASSSLLIPPATREVIQQILRDTSIGAFGVIGVLLVLVSATSLSRALARMYAAIWQLPRPRSSARSWWRWLAVVLAFAMSLLATRGLVRVAEGLTPSPVWSVAFVWTVYAVLLLAASYVLLAGALPLRVLVPGALLGGFAMSVVGRVVSLWLPTMLRTSEERYGAIGVAFSYLGVLYCFSFALILATVIGTVLVRDDSAFGAWLRGGWTG